MKNKNIDFFNKVAYWILGLSVFFSIFLYIEKDLINLSDELFNNETIGQIKVPEENFNLERYSAKEQKIKRWLVNCNKKIYNYCSLAGNVYAEIDDHENAVKYLAMGCDNNDIHGCYMFASYYERYIKDNKLAIIYYKKSCELGYEPGCARSSQLLIREEKEKNLKN